MIHAGPPDLRNNFKHSLPRPYGRGYYITALQASQLFRIVHPSTHPRSQLGRSCPSERLSFRDFTAEEFLGRTLTIGARGCVSVFQESSLTLGQMADACVYVGGGADVDSKAKRLDSIQQRQD
jgi:hypothetical protein